MFNLSFLSLNILKHPLKLTVFYYFHHLAFNMILGIVFQQEQFLFQFSYILILKMIRNITYNSDHNIRNYQIIYINLLNFDSINLYGTSYSNKSGLNKSFIL